MSTDVITQDTRDAWIARLQKDYPLFNVPGYAEVLIDKYLNEPEWFQPENIEKVLQEFAGKAQEMRGPVVPAKIEVLTGEESDAIWKPVIEKHAQEYGDLEVVPKTPSEEDTELIKNVSLTAQKDGDDVEGHVHGE